MFKTEAIKKFLKSNTHSDLSDLYSLDMECQVNVAQDGGERVDGEFKGRQWHGWTDDLTIWKSFRIPFNAGKDPHYEDIEITFDLEEHAEGIGMTGWDWKNQKSRWVAFDFDAIIGHSDKHNVKLKANELDEVKNQAFKIPWTTIKHSTSGKGLHIYVFIDSRIRIKNHFEHASLARSILGLMSAISGFNFNSRVDICGGNMWVWHRKMANTNGLITIKKGIPLTKIPDNWKDHINVIKGVTRKNVPFWLKDQTYPEIDKLFDQVSNESVHIPLDDEHKKLINFLKDINAVWWWDQDRHHLVTHTVFIKEAYDELDFKGIFKTISEGKERGIDHNCFLSPLYSGAWSIRRYSPGVQEAETWIQDENGWTMCYLNKDPDLRTASYANEGVEHPMGGYVFRHASLAQQTVFSLGSDLGLPNWANGRKTKIKQHKDGRRLIVEIDRDESDFADEMKGWIPEKGSWKKILSIKNTQITEPKLKSLDEFVRHIVSISGSDCGWVIRSANIWRPEPLVHIKAALKALDISHKEIEMIIGGNVIKCWTLINQPFKEEYPGDRQWNRDSCQLSFQPTQDLETLSYPTWMKLLNQCGSTLNEYLENNGWAKANGIKTGGDYLKIWVASLLQEPTEPLPYLFLYGPQAGGKTLLHEAISLLMTMNGYQRADTALISQSGFNHELANSILCIVEEVDLQRNKLAYNRIKDWVTNQYIQIHKKGSTPYMIRNTMHWIQTSNEHTACPVFSGDTRITMIFVDQVDPSKWETRRSLVNKLEKEAPDFLAEILNLEIPPSVDRLNVPIISTREKIQAQEQNKNLVESFIDDCCHYSTGSKLKFGDFYTKFINWLDADEKFSWGRKKTSQLIPPHFCKGRSRLDNQLYLGNISFEAPIENNKLAPITIDFEGKITDVNS